MQFYYLTTSSQPSYKVAATTTTCYNLEMSIWATTYIKTQGGRVLVCSHQFLRRHVPTSIPISAQQQTSICDNPLPNQTVMLGTPKTPHTET